MDPDSVKSTLSNLAFGNVMAAAARDYQKVPLSFSSFFHLRTVSSLALSLLLASIYHSEAWYETIHWKAWRGLDLNIACCLLLGTTWWKLDFSIPCYLLPKITQAMHNSYSTGWFTLPMFTDLIGRISLSLGTGLECFFPLVVKKLKECYVPFFSPGNWRMECVTCWNHLSTSSLISNAIFSIH